MISYSWHSWFSDIQTWIGIYTIGSLALRPSFELLNFTIGFPGSSTCRCHVSFHNTLSQYFIISLSLSYVCVYSVFLNNLNIQKDILFIFMMLPTTDGCRLPTLMLGLTMDEMELRHSLRKRSHGHPINFYPRKKHSPLFKLAILGPRIAGWGQGMERKMLNLFPNI